MKKLLKWKISFCEGFYSPPRVQWTDNLPSCDVHLTGSVDFLLRLLRSKESIVDHEVVHLRNFLCQSVMFPQEGEKFFARPVDCHLLWQEIFILQHVLEENLAQATSLSWLMDVKVQNTWCIDMASLTELIKDVEGFAADFKKTNN